MSPNALESVLQKIFEAEGDPRAAHNAAKVSEYLVHHRMVKMQDVDRSIRDQKIYELRAYCTEQEIAVRYELTVRMVRRIVHDQTALRQAVA